jgi:hypothetical protein
MIPDSPRTVWVEMPCVSCGTVWNVLTYPDCPPLFWCYLCKEG